MKEKNNNSNDQLTKYSYNAVNLLRNYKTGILSTISKKNANYPFGSFTTFITARNRTIYLYLSDIAQHTINFKTDSKACLTISKISNKNDDVQNSQRLTLMGDIKEVREEEIEYCKNKFHYLLPESKKYSNFHGFNFYQLEINCVRWIGGFGKISWLDTKDWRNFTPKWKESEDSIINHMNKDHSNSIASSLNAQHSIQDLNCKMIFITIDGYYTICKKGVFFIQLDEKCETSAEYKDQLINLAKKYRSFELSK